MVLRGSNIKPDESLNKNINELKEHQKDFENLDKELIDVHKKSVNQLLDAIESKDNIKKEELYVIAEELRDKFQNLENAQIESAIEIEKRNDAIQRTVKELACGGTAGSFARTFVAPVDRVKILIQTATITGKSKEYNSIVGTASKIYKAEGLSGFWRGNLTNCVRVVPHTATQFVSYEKYKPLFVKEGEGMSIPKRLMAGALSGMTAATVTHPMDVVRINLQTKPELKGATDVMSYIFSNYGIKGFYKGYFPAMLSLSPFIAINFATFDTLKVLTFGDKKVSKQELKKRNPAILLGLGAASGIIAQTCCYPLDTVRRRMQIATSSYSSTPNAFITILKTEGFLGFYKGMIPNAIKVVPNNAIRFAAFETLKNNFVPAPLTDDEAKARARKLRKRKTKL